MGVCIWSNDLFKVRHTRVRNNKPHLQAHHMRIQHGKYCFLLYLRQGNVFGLDVECLKLGMVCVSQ